MPPPLYPSPTNITTINDMFIYVNTTLTSGVYGYGILVIVFMVAYLNFNLLGRYETMTSIRAAMFVMGLVAILEFTLGWIGNFTLGIAIALNLILLLIDYKK